jgi:Mrp family chromosome partitioning ATPase
MPPLPRLPLLWIAGAPGVGKSTTAWRAFAGALGSPAAYLDIDQLGMIFPSPVDDPDRERVKAANLAGVVPCYAAAGVAQLLVSGVIDPEGVGAAREALAAVAEPTICQLRAGEETLRTRLVDRGWPDVDVQRALAEQRQLDRAGLDARIDTDGMSVEAVAAMLPAVARAGQLGEYAGTRPPSSAEIPLVVVTGPRAVGKSTVAWALFQQRVAAGQRTAFVDLEQLGFAHVGDAEMARLRVRNLAAVARVFRERGAGEVIVNGRITQGELEVLTRWGGVRIVRLTAAASAIHERVVQRAFQGGPGRLAGDDLEDADEAQQAAVERLAHAQERWYAQRAVGDVVVSTSDRAADDIATEVIALLDGILSRR